MKSLKQSHSAEIPKRGRPLGFWHFSLLQNIKKLDGKPFEGKKHFEKVAQCRKKLKEGTLQSRPLSQMLEKVSG